MDIPVLPHKLEDKLTFPCGSWVGVYYSEELLLAHKYGYEFLPILGLVYDCSEAFLEPYVKRFSEMKAMGGVYRFIGKLFINSLYGKFGLKRDDRLTILIPSHKEQYYSNRFDIYDRVDLENGYILLTFSPKPVLEKYKSGGIFSTYKKDSQTYRTSFKFTESNVAIAAAITALGRMRLHEDMMSVQKNGGKIAYCDSLGYFFKKLALFKNGHNSKN
uniref:DNA-directed DNA polymerase n=1 Tax=Amphimedon queenslandica TaxID=400682 RepID=A0A1X7TG59_AMPQE